MVTCLKTKNDINVFDRDLIKRRRERIKANFSKHDFLFQWGKNQLNDRIMDINKTFEIGLELGSRGTLGSHPKINTLFTLDITESPSTKCNHYIQGDEEFLPVKAHSTDVIISNLNLHSINDLPGVLLQIRNTLKDDGLFIASMLGGETLHELRNVMTDIELNHYGGASPHVAPFADKYQMGSLLQRAGFSLPVIDSEIITVTYDNAFKLFHDLRGMGESNYIIERKKTPLSKAFFMDVAQNYQNKFSDENGKIIASFEVIFLLGWAPHESQQKPLRPGSAKHRLADLLGTKEIGTGDKVTP